MTRPPYRPIPGKFTFDLSSYRIVKVVGYGSDTSGEYVTVRLAGSYGATVRLALSLIRPLTDLERHEVAERAGSWK